MVITTLKQKISLILFGLFISIILLELGLRICGFIIISIREYDNYLGGKKKGVYRIMCLGESTTQGDAKSSWPSQLEKILNDKAAGIKISVINNGWSGVNTTYILNKLQADLDKYNPDMLIVMMGINDNGAHMPSGWHNNSFINSFRTYKLSRLISTHFLAKYQKNFNVSTPNKVGNMIDEIYILGTMDNLSEQSMLKAIEMNPKNTMAYLALARLYAERNHHFNLAEDFLLKALEFNPKNDCVYTALGYILMVQDKLYQAEQFLLNAVEINPKNDLAYSILGWFYIQTGDSNLAEKSLRKAKELNYSASKLYDLLPVFCRDKNKFKTIRKFYYEKGFNLRLFYYNSATRQNYRKLKDAAAQRGIRLVCVQYPMRKLAPLKNIFDSTEGIIFVDNEMLFKNALKNAKYEDYFTDTFAGDFGHCTLKGDILLAKNIAQAILKEAHFAR